MDPFADDKYAKFRQQSYALRTIDCVRSSSWRQGAGALLVVLGGCIALLVGAIWLNLGPFHSNHDAAASVGAEAAVEAPRHQCSSALPLIRDGLAALVPGGGIPVAPDASLCDVGEAELRDRASCAVRCLRGEGGAEVQELRAAVVQLYRALRAAFPSKLRERSLPEAARRLVEREVGGAIEERDRSSSYPTRTPREEGASPGETLDGMRRPAVAAAGGDAGGIPREVETPATEVPGDSEPMAQRPSPEAGPAAVAPEDGSGPVAPASAHPHLRHSAQRNRAPRAVPEGGAVRPSEGAGDDLETARRRAAVRRAMQHAWAGYRRFAWGKDSLKPVSQRADSEFVGMALTAIDAMDTLQLMDLRSEYGEARQLVMDAVSVGHQQGINLFETTIRVVGGMISASHLDGDDALLRSAAKLADAMSFAFETQTGLPFGTLDLRTRKKSNPSWSQRSSTVSEVASLQVEWQTLARLTGNATYAALVDRVTRHLDRLAPADGLYPMFISPDTGRFSSNMITLGARADSLYEYLLKQWLLDRGGAEPQTARRMYEASMEGVRSSLLAVTAPSHLAYIAERRGTKREDKMDHLVCFVPGMLLLGAHDWREPPGRRPVRPDGSQGGGDGPASPTDATTRAVSGDVAATHRRLAQQLARTCYEMYRRYPSGLAPELVHLRVRPPQSLPLCPVAPPTPRAHTPAAATLRPILDSTVASIVRRQRPGRRRRRPTRPGGGRAI